MNQTQSEMSLDSRMEAYEERRKKVQQFNMTNDIFFCKVLEDQEACQEVIRIFLDKPDIKIQEVTAQYSIRNVESRSVFLDILAEGIDGKLFNVEMQIDDDEDHQRRVRYYVASIDMSFLEKGIPYEELPEVYMIFITKRDFLKRKSGLYHVDRTIRNDGTVIDNGIHEIYANLTCRSGNEKLDELLAYMKNSDSNYQTEVFPNVVRKVSFLKEKKEGVNVMCSILEEERSEGRIEGKNEGRIEGEAIKLISLIRKKAVKDISVEECADMLEEDIDLVGKIYGTIKVHPDWEDSKVLEEMRATE